MLSNFLLFALFTFGEEVISPQLSADIIIFKDSKGMAIAQIGSFKAEKDSGLRTGDILIKSKKDYEVIQTALDTLKPVGSKYEGQKCGGKILIRRGVYNLGKVGINLPYPSQLVIEGEGFDTNLPTKKWLGGTYLIYSGKDIAIKYKDVKGPAGYFSLELKNFTLVLKKSCIAGIRIPIISQKYIESISVIALKPSKWGVHLDGAGGNSGYLKNVFVIGPFDTGIDINTDWCVGINLNVKGYKLRAINSAFTTTIIGGLIETE